MLSEQIVLGVAKGLQITSKQVEVVLGLLEEGNTVPFIARYRKEATGALDEDQIREIYKTYEYQANLLKKKEDVIRLIDEKGMLTEELKQSILKCTKLSEVEDLYRPYKEKKKTRATEAIAKGLEPLAKWILSLPKEGSLEGEATQYLNDQVLTVEDALAGAQDIIAEFISDQAEYRQYLKKQLTQQGIVKTKVKKTHSDEKKVYEMYYDYQEPIKRIVAHRILALNRAEKEKVITVSLEYDANGFYAYVLSKMVKQQTIVEAFLKEAILDSYKRLIKPSVDREIRSELTEKAEVQAMEVFSINVEKLLLQAPLKDKMMLGVDPAYRTGCKLAVIDATGKVLTIDKIYPTTTNDSSRDAKKVADLVNTYHIDVIAIGNGTASRETERFISDVIDQYKLQASYIIVSEAGASVYSASKVAQEEFPDFQVEERSAVSIARRVQDPLAELVKIDPKSISVGQYQHDMNQSNLEDQLSFVVSKTVNQVGVDLNTASPSLLSYVSGLSKSVAKNIVSYRESKGRFESRKGLLEVAKLGQKAFEQAAGFLRIVDGKETLDKTSIHPESYDKAYEILALLGANASQIGSDELKLKIANMNQEQVANQLNIDLYTLVDILDAFVAPMRSPRDHYQTPLLKTNILKLDDLSVGLELEGTVRNVVDFGAFVDIGLKNDGLVHISRMTKSFIKHPLEVVNVGDIVKVYVYSVDIEKQKVGLSFLPV